MSSLYENKDFTGSENGCKLAVDVSGLSKVYKKRAQHIHALKDIDLKIFEGEFVAITGASGSGKSTLLNMLAGLDKPSFGEVKIFEQLLRKMSDKKLSRFRNQMIGFIFQSFYLQPFLNVYHNIAVPAMPLRTKKKDVKRRVDSLAKSLGIADMLGRLPRELSGGQVQRVAIARALVNSPRIILADEPTGNLDPTSSGYVLDMLRAAQRDLGVTVIVATHDSAVVAAADRSVVLEHGGLVK